MSETNKMNYEQRKIFKNTLLILGLVLILMGTVVGTQIGKEIADYERDMCNNLDVNSPISFDLDLEISATTQKDCYEANHYKYFDFQCKFLGGLLGCLISIMFVLLLGSLIYFINDELF